MRIGTVPSTLGSAAENMALDQWLLDRVDRETPVWFRHYGWRSHAFTFGYTQRHAEVVAFLQGIRAMDSECCRRPTGGGIVDHRKDWTYALALHRDSPWGRLAPLELYRCLHECLARALTEVAAPAVRLFQPHGLERAPEACFERPSPFDLLHAETGLKVAGAALKRTRKGVLIQGSLSRERLVGTDFAGFGDCLIGRLQREPALAMQGTLLVSPPNPIPGVAAFACRSWLERR